MRDRTSNTTPPPADQAPAAVRYGWGTLLPIPDEFGNTGPVDLATWSVPGRTVGGTAGSGRAQRQRPALREERRVANGIMTMTGEANGDTGVAQTPARPAVRPLGDPAAFADHRCLGAVPPVAPSLADLREWPQDGEYDCVGYTDPDAEWFRISGGGGPNGRQNIQTMPSGHLNIQLDNFTGSGGLRPAAFEVDGVRIYS